MNEGAIAAVRESQPIAKAKVPRSRTANARRHAGTDRIGPRSRKGPRVFVRSEMRPKSTAVTPAAKENRENRRPNSKESVVNRNEPRGVAIVRSPSTPPCPANAKTVREFAAGVAVAKSDEIGATMNRRTKNQVPSTMEPPPGRRAPYQPTAAVAHPTTD